MSSDVGQDFQIGNDAFFGRLHSMVGGEDQPLKPLHYLDRKGVLPQWGRPSQR